MPQTFYTEKEFIEAIKEGKDYKSMMACICDRFRGFGHPINERDRYSYIAMDISTVKQEIEIASNLLKATKKRQAPIFLDAGCGIGVTLMIARQNGFKPFGIEFNVKLAEIAVMLGDVWPRSDIFIGDIMDYKDYSKCDVIYYYCPFENVEMQKKFEKLVENNAKKGAIIIANLKQDNTIEKDKRFKRIIFEGHTYEGSKNQIWQKVAMKVPAGKTK
jgi:hypothetical protein